MPEENKTIPEQPVTPNANGGGQGQPVTFTQEQLDAIIKDRLKRAEESTTSKIFSELGIENLDAAKKTLTEAEKAKQAQMSELEKAKAEITKLEEKAKKAQAEAEQARLRAEEMRLQSLVISKAGAFVDPMDAWLFLDRSKLAATEDGNYTGIDEAIKAIAESKPYLVKADSANTQKPGTPARPTPKTMAEKLLEKKDQEPAKVRVNF